VVSLSLLDQASLPSGRREPSYDLADPLLPSARVSSCATQPRTPQTARLSTELLSSLSQRARVIVLGLFGAGLAFFVFGGLRSGGSSSDPNDAVPRDSFLVASLNLAELRRSPLHAVLLGDPTGGPNANKEASIGSKALGIGKLADACGFDPLSRVDQLSVAVPEEGDKGELGLAARITVSRDELQKCTSALADQRGAKVATKEVGSFAVVEDSSSTDGVRPRLAYGHGGLLIAGRGAWFDAMLDTADGKKPGVKEAATHLAMRSSLTNRDGWRVPTLVVTALLPRPLRDRIKNEMGAEIGSKDNSQKIMAGVLGVSSVGLALKAGERGQNTDLAIELSCDSPDGCEAVEKLVLKKRLDWGKELALRMIGLGPLLDSIDVKRDGARLRVTASAPAEALAQTIDRIIRLKSSRAASAGSDESPPSFPGLGIPSNKDQRAPDETIPAKKLAPPPEAPASSAPASSGRPASSGSAPPSAPAPSAPSAPSVPAPSRSAGQPASSAN
jgi:hypothetical protein